MVDQINHVLHHLDDDKREGCCLIKRNRTLDPWIPKF